MNKAEFQKWRTDFFDNSIKIVLQSKTTDWSNESIKKIILDNLGVQIRTLGIPEDYANNVINIATSICIKFLENYSKFSDIKTKEEQLLESKTVDYDMDQYLYTQYSNLKKDLEKDLEIAFQNAEGSMYMQFIDKLNQKLQKFETRLNLVLEIDEEFESSGPKL